MDRLGGASRVLLSSWIAMRMMRKYRPPLRFQKQHPAASPSKGRKVEVVLPAPRVTIGRVKGTTVSPFAE
jgi:hypothetical protein